MAKRHRARAKAKKACRNPVALALEWRRAIDGGLYSTQADLARHLGVSRVRVTQILNVLRLSRPAVDLLEELGDPLPASMVTERQLRPLARLPARGQMKALKIILGGTPRLVSQNVVLLWHVPRNWMDRV